MRDEDFERLYGELAPGLLGFLVYRTGDRALAEDVMADTFERVLRKRRRFDPRRGSEKAWLYAIALNRLRDHLRRVQAEGRAVEGLRARADALVPDAADSVLRSDELARALGTLSDEEREAVALRYGGGLTAPEIARLKRVRLTTAEGRIYRALRKLRAELG